MAIEGKIISWEYPIPMSLFQSARTQFVEHLMYKFKSMKELGTRRIYRLRQLCGVSNNNYKLINWDYLQHFWHHVNQFHLKKTFVWFRNKLREKRLVFS